MYCAVWDLRYHLMYHTWLSVGDFDTPHLPFQTYHPGRGLFSHLAHFWWPTPSPVLPECYCSRRCLSLLPLFAFMKTPQRHNGNWCTASRTKWHLYKISRKATGTNVECDVQKEEQQQMQLSEIAAQHWSEHSAIRSGAGRMQSVWSRFQEASTTTMFTRTVWTGRPGDHVRSSVKLLYIFH